MLLITSQAKKYVLFVMICNYIFKSNFYLFFDFHAAFYFLFIVH